MPRWGMTSIDVYLPEHEFSGTVRSAFSTWSAASGNKVRFRFNNTRFASNNAPIRVNFVDEKAPYYITKATRSETTGYFTNMEVGFINRGNLTIYTKTYEDKPVLSDNVYKNALTEVGYILGLDKIYGNCDKSTSIMCVGGNAEALSSEDRRNILNKYNRTSEDIKNAKSKNK